MAHNGTGNSSLGFSPFYAQMPMVSISGQHFLDAKWLEESEDEAATRRDGGKDLKWGMNRLRFPLKATIG